MGTYTQVSNDFHVYTKGAGGKVWDRISGFVSDIDTNIYSYFKTLVLMNPDQMDMFDHDLSQFFSIYDKFGLEEVGNCVYWESQYFRELVLPMLCVYLTHKSLGANEALKFTDKIVADDWRKACTDWLEMRVN